MDPAMVLQDIKNTSGSEVELPPPPVVRRRKRQRLLNKNISNSLSEADINSAQGFLDIPLLQRLQMTMSENKAANASLERYTISDMVEGNFCSEDPADEAMATGECDTYMEPGEAIDSLIVNASLNVTNIAVKLSTLNEGETVNSGELDASQGAGGSQSWLDLEMSNVDNECCLDQAFIRVNSTKSPVVSGGALDSRPLRKSFGGSDEVTCSVSVGAAGMDTAEDTRACSVVSTDSVHVSSDLLEIAMEDQHTATSNLSVDMGATPTDTWVVADINKTCTANANRTTQHVSVKSHAVSGVNNELMGPWGHFGKVCTSRSDDSSNLMTISSEENFPTTARNLSDPVQVDMTRRGSKRRKDSSRRRSQKFFSYMSSAGGARSLLEMAEDPTHGHDASVESPPLCVVSDGRRKSLRTTLSSELAVTVHGVTAGIVSVESHAADPPLLESRNEENKKKPSTRSKSRKTLPRNAVRTTQSTRIQSAMTSATDTSSAALGKRAGSCDEVMYQAHVDAFGMDTDEGERVSDINRANCLEQSSDLLQITEDQIITASSSLKVDIHATGAEAYDALDCTVNGKTARQPMLQLPVISGINDERRKKRARSKKIHISPASDADNTGADAASLSVETMPLSQPLRLKTASSSLEGLDVLTVGVCDERRSKQRKSSRRRSQNVFPCLLPHGSATSLLEETEPTSEGREVAGELTAPPLCLINDGRRGSRRCRKRSPLDAMSSAPRVAPPSGSRHGTEGQPARLEEGDCGTRPAGGSDMTGLRDLSSSRDSFMETLQKNQLTESGDDDSLPSACVIDDAMRGSCGRHKRSPPQDEEDALQKETDEPAKPARLCVINDGRRRGGKKRLRPAPSSPEVTETAQNVPLERNATADASSDADVTVENHFAGPPLLEADRKEAKTSMGKRCKSHKIMSWQESSTPALVNTPPQPETGAGPPLFEADRKEAKTSMGKRCKSRKIMSRQESSTPDLVKTPPQPETENKTSEEEFLLSEEVKASSQLNEFDDLDFGEIFAPIKKPTKQPKRRRRSSDYDLSTTVLTPSPDNPDTGLGWTEKLLPSRRSKRLRRKSLDLYRVSIEKSKKVEEAKWAKSLLSAEILAELQEDADLPKDVSVVEELEGGATYLGEAEDSSVDDLAGTDGAVEDSAGGDDAHLPKTPPEAVTIIALSDEVSPSDLADSYLKPKRSGRKKACQPSLEDIYLNRLWRMQMPKDKVWETIFEVPKLSKWGSEEVMSNKRLKRHVNFDDFYQTTRLKRRRQRALKLGWRPLTEKRDQIAAINLEERLQLLDWQMECEEMGTTPGEPSAERCQEEQSELSAQSNKPDQLEQSEQASRYEPLKTFEQCNKSEQSEQSVQSEQSEQLEQSTLTGCSLVLAEESDDDANSASQSVSSPMSLGPTQETADSDHSASINTADYTLSPLTESASLTLSPLSHHNV